MDLCSLCPELDVASQGESVEEARNNLREAVELFFELPTERNFNRLNNEVYVIPLEVEIETAADLSGKGVCRS